MNTNPDRLDDAIDLVAARMTNVAEDDGLAMRIANVLPERTGWVSRIWIARFATASLAALILTVVLRTFDEGSTEVLRTEVASAPAPATGISIERPSSDRRTSVEQPLIARRTIVEPVLNRRRAISDVERPDHERSLEPIASPAALTVGFLTPAELPAEDALEVAPLAIADLPLTTDFSPRR